MKTCSTEGCARRAHARGVCTSHYEQLPEVRQRRLARIEQRRAYDRVRNKTEKRRLRDRIRNQDPKRKAAMRACDARRLSTPEGRARRAEQLRRYRERREAAMKLATPAWVDVETLEKAYQACPPGLAVDHIVPILGRNVCGLNVPWNLQYLTPLENSRKGNRIES